MPLDPLAGSGGFLITANIVKLFICITFFDLLTGSPPSKLTVSCFFHLPEII